MLARTQRFLLRNVLSLVLFIPAYGASDAGQNSPIAEPECEERKRASMEMRLSGTAIHVVEGLPLNRYTEEIGIVLVQIDFGHIHAEGTRITYGCKPVEVGEYTPAYAGFAWAVVMPHMATFSLIDPRDDWSGDTTIHSYLDREGSRSGSSVSALRMLVSGPFWRLGRGGEVPIGALVIDHKERQKFRTNFSARYVLCSKKEGGIELMVGSKWLEEPALKECAAAIQVGPALFESDNGYAKLGIGADSRNRSRRNVLIKVESDAPGERSGGSLVLLSTLFDIASYDAMVASEALVRKISHEGKIVWAVGLVDDESLSGPILTMDGRPTLELTEGSRPTGAIMQFIFDEGESGR